MFVRYYESNIVCVRGTVIYRCAAYIVFVQFLFPPIVPCTSVYVCVCVFASNLLCLPHFLHSVFQIKCTNCILCWYHEYIINAILILFVYICINTWPILHQKKSVLLRFVAIRGMPCVRVYWLFVPFFPYQIRFFPLVHCVSIGNAH